MTVRGWMYGWMLKKWSENGKELLETENMMIKSLQKARGITERLPETRIESQRNGKTIRESTQDSQHS